MFSFKELFHLWVVSNYRESYSAIAAEVPIMSDPSTQVDPRLIESLKKAEKVIFIILGMIICNFNVEVDCWRRST